MSKTKPNFTAEGSVDPALVTAHEAENRSGVRILELHESSQLKSASRILDVIWSVPEGRPMVQFEFLTAFSKTGNYLAGAYLKESMVAVIVGFAGLDDFGPYLHSHILGVLPEVQDREVGFALKQHQRAWAISKGMAHVTWTTDPLVRRNAFFNITKLGAEAIKYHRNLYGEMSDGVNTGDHTDRLLIDWKLESDHAIAAAQRQFDEPDIEQLTSSGAEPILSEDTNGMPVPRNGRGDLLLCQVPEDIVRIRQQDPERASAWRMALRAALGDALDSGYVVTGFARAGYYVLTRPDK